MKDRTRVVHHPTVSQDGFRSLTVPTFRASTIVFEDAEAYATRRARGPDGYTYGLNGTPTTRTLEAQLSMLECAERTLLAPSGQCAIAVIFLTVLEPGDKVLIPDSVYPPVSEFCANYLKKRGIEHERYDPLIGPGISELFDARTKLVWMESPGSATMEFQDVRAIVTAARAQGILTGCDNTWATPLLFKPIVHGVDFSMEALTKYVGGHSDLLLGSVSVADVALHRKLKETMRLMGIGVSPDDCQLALRGLETLGVRLAHVGTVAADFARRIDGKAGVERVLHPVLPTCPGREFWERDFGGASGAFSIVLKPQASSVLDHALSRLEVFAIGASWGGTRSLLAPMSVKAERLVTPWTHDGMILRLSIGLEDPIDLWEDLERFFAALAAESECVTSAG
ncbi:MAG: PLP-dependent transferase [Pseudomonadota bacterium]